MAIHPKARALANKLSTPSTDVKNRLARLMTIMNEIIPAGEPSQDIDSMHGSALQYDDGLPPMTRKEKLQALLAILGFLILYTVAGSIAAVAWTPCGTVVLH